MKKYTDRDYLRIFREVLPRIKYALFNWDFDDINRAARGGAKMGIFILASCYIDHLSCFYYGQDSCECNYINFVNKFLPKYNGRNLYKSMRCKLVHNYSEGGKYSFIHNHSNLHLKLDRNSRTIINLRSFINDLKEARDRYFKLLEKDDSLKIKMAKRYKNVGILGPQKLKL